MTRDEIVDFLEWAKEEGQLQFPESRKVDMAERYLEAHNQALGLAHVIKSVCDMCGSSKLEECTKDEYSCEDCGHFPITN